MMGKDVFFSDLKDEKEISMEEDKKDMEKGTRKHGTRRRGKRATLWNRKMRQERGEKK